MEDRYFNPFSTSLYPHYTLSETDFKLMILEDALSHLAKGYTARKSFAEKSAWDFMDKEKPGFSLSVINPNLVLIPIIISFDS